MSKRTIKIIACASLTIVWTVVIFSMSLQPADESHELSGGIVDWLISNVLSPLLGDFESLNHIVRKLAHFAEYTGLGIFAVTTLYQISLRKKSMWAVIYCIIVASIDETIQKFNPGRSGQLSDVLLDSLGGLCGVLIVVLIVYVIRRRKHEKG